VSGSQPFPQATEGEREKDAGDPIGSRNALAQTNATAKDPADAAAAEKAAELVVTPDMAALAAAMQRMQQDHVASMAVLYTQLQTQFADQLRAYHQAWWLSTAKDQAAARALVRTHLMELAGANANTLAVNTALDKVASSALQSHLLVQNLENKLSKQVKHEITKAEHRTLYRDQHQHERDREGGSERPISSRRHPGGEKNKQCQAQNLAYEDTHKDTCAFMPGCNDPRSVAAYNRRKLPGGQACACYRPVDTSSAR
jgi:hypothetical protein